MIGFVVALFILLLLLGPPLLIVVMLWMVGSEFFFFLRGYPEDNTPEARKAFLWGLFWVFVVFAALIIPQFIFYGNPDLSGFAGWVNVFNGKDVWGK